jgi:hypothetical protein
VDKAVTLTRGLFGGLATGFFVVLGEGLSVGLPVGLTVGLYVGLTVGLLTGLLVGPVGLLVGGKKHEDAPFPDIIPAGQMEQNAAPSRE